MRTYGSRNPLAHHEHLSTREKPSPPIPRPSRPPYSSIRRSLLPLQLVADHIAIDHNRSPASLLTISLLLYSPSLESIPSSILVVNPHDEPAGERCPSPSLFKLLLDRFPRVHCDLHHCQQATTASSTRRDPPNSATDDDRRRLFGIGEPDFPLTAPPLSFTKHRHKIKLLPLHLFHHSPLFVVASSSFFSLF